MFCTASNASNDAPELGKSGNTDRLATEQDIRRALELTSTDPIATAWELLARPNAPWLGSVLDDDQKRHIGSMAVDRYAESRSTVPTDYADLLEGIRDPYAFEWSPRRFSMPPPIGRQS